jgi:hypothetical protein
MTLNRPTRRTRLIGMSSPWWYQKVELLRLNHLHPVSSTGNTGYEA